MATRSNGARRRTAAWASLALAGGLLATAAWLRPDWFASGERAPAAYVGRDACVECHAAESARFQGSHHDLAMQEATEATVLGDFRNATFTHFGVTSTFFRKDGRFLVRTDGPDGKLHEYPITW